MKEQIQKRMDELMEEGKKLETQIHMINGALQQCQWQLAELEKQEPKAEETQ
jgi:chromosome segregation ATPase